jgi:hypothetical protein
VRGGGAVRYGMCVRVHGNDGKTSLIQNVRRDKRAFPSQGTRTLCTIFVVLFALFLVR